RATRSSGPRPRRRRRTTSTTCPRSAPSGRSSTPGTAGRRPTEALTMTSATPTASELAQHEVLPSHSAGGIGNPVLGMLLFITSEVMFFAGLFAAYFSIRAGYTELIGGQPVHVWPPTQFENLLNPFALTTESGD